MTEPNIYNMNEQLIPSSNQILARDIETEIVEWEQREHITAFFHKRFIVFVGTGNSLVYES